jgi:hypothetical protein
MNQSIQFSKMKRKLQQEKKENFLNKKVKLSDSIYGTLPNEILQNIFSYLLPTTKSEMKFFTDLSLVSKPWHQYFNNEEEETSSKMFWLEFYKKYFGLEEDLFKEEIKTLTTTDIKEIFFERYQQENVKDSAYIEIPINADYVKSLIDSVDLKVDEKKISELILLLKSKKSLIITGIGCHSENIRIDRTEYEYGMEPRELTLSLSGTFFLRNSFSIDFNLHYEVTYYYEDEPEKSEFELKINEKKIVEFVDQMVVHSTSFEKICDSVEVENHKSFFILLMVNLFYLIEDDDTLSKSWKGYGRFDKFSIMDRIFDIIENMDLQDEDER